MFFCFFKYLKFNINIKKNNKILYEEKKLKNFLKPLEIKGFF